MSFTVQREDLLCSVSLASEAVPTKTVNPILANVRLSVNGVLTVQATDMDTTISSDCPIQGNLDFGDPPLPPVLVPADLLYDILRGSRDETLTLDFAGTLFTINGERTDAAVTTAPDGAWPGSITKDQPGKHVLSSETLGRLLDLTIFAASTTAVRYSINGVLFYLEEGKATLVATDCRTMSITDAPAMAVNGHHTTANMSVVPLKAAKLLSRCISKANGEVSCAFTKNEALFSSENWRMSCRLLEGMYPNFRFVQEAKSPLSCRISLAEFAASIKAVSVITTIEKVRLVTLRFSPGNLELIARGLQGHSRTNMVIEDGKECEIALNADLVLQMLSKIAHYQEKGSLTDLQFGTGEAPLYFRCPGFTYMVACLSRPVESPKPAAEEGSKL